MESEIKTSKGIKYKLNYVPDAMKNLKIKFKVSKPKICIIDSEIDSAIINPSLTIPNKNRHNSIQSSKLGKVENTSRNNPQLIHKARHSSVFDSQHEFNTISLRPDYLNTISNEKVSNAYSKLYHSSEKENIIKCVFPKKMSTLKLVGDNLKSNILSSNMSLDSFQKKELLLINNKKLLKIKQVNGSGKDSVTYSVSKPKNLAFMSSEFVFNKNIQSYQDSNYKQAVTKQYYIPKPQFILKKGRDISIDASNNTCTRLNTVTSNHKSDIQLAYTSHSPENAKLKFSNHSLSKGAVPINMTEHNTKKSVQIKNFKEKLMSMVKISIDHTEMTNLKRLYSNGKIDSTPSKGHKSKDSKSKADTTTHYNSTLENAIENEKTLSTIIPTEIRKGHQKSYSLQDSLNNILKRTKRVIEASIKLKISEN